MRYLAIIIGLCLITVASAPVWACDGDSIGWSIIDTTTMPDFTLPDWGDVVDSVVDSLWRGVPIPEEKPTTWPTLTVEPACTLWLENIDRLRVIVKPVAKKKEWWEDYVQPYQITYDTIRIGGKLHLMAY